MSSKNIMTGIDQPLVSVIMSIYNEPKDYLIASIESILNQTYRNIQFVIVLDNPSNILANTLVKQYMQKDSRIVFFENEENIGLVSSLNKAVSLTSGDYIARMDADDISMPNRIDKELKYLKAHFLDLVGCNIINFYDIPTELNTITRFPETHKGLANYLLFDSCIPHPTWLGKREVFETLDGYRPIDACEDYDFLTRLVISDFKLGVLQEPLLFYRINQDGISNTNKSTQKTSLSILRSYFRQGRVIAFEDYQFLMESSVGKKIYKKNEEYYTGAKALKAQHGIRFIYKGILLFIKSSIGREVLLYGIIEAVLKRLYIRKES